MTIATPAPRPALVADFHTIDGRKVKFVQIPAGSAAVGDLLLFPDPDEVDRVFPITEVDPDCGPDVCIVFDSQMGEHEHFTSPNAPVWVVAS